MNPHLQTLGTIAGVLIGRQTATGTIRFRSGAMIDADGSDNRHRDPDWQPETSLRIRGKSIDAESVPFVVVPPLIVQGVYEIVLGCQAEIRNTRNGRSCLCVVADVGPRAKIGEISCEAARRIGLDGDPRHGGTESPIVEYRIFPGVPAVVDGVTYDLQRSS